MYPHSDAVQILMLLNVILLSQVALTLGIYFMPMEKMLRDIREKNSQEPISPA